MKKVATILILTLMALSTLTAAQTRKIVRAEVSFEFIANGKKMPAAFYTITVSRDSLAVLSISAVSLSSISVRRLSQPAGTTVLVFRRYGAQYFLSGIRCEGEDTGYELPAGKTEMELLKNATEGDKALIAGAK